MRGDGADHLERSVGQVGHSISDVRVKGATVPVFYAAPCWDGAVLVNFCKSAER